MTGALMQAASGGGQVQFDAATYLVLDFVISPGTAQAQIRFEADGEIRNQDSNLIGTWFTGAPVPSVGDAYQIRATPNPDTPDSGTMNTWLNMSITNSWREDRTGTGQDDAVFDIEIRAASSGQVIDSCTVTLRAIVDL